MNSDTGERRHIDMGNIDQIGTSERVGSFEATTKLWAVPFQCWLLAIMASWPSMFAEGKDNNTTNEDVEHYVIMSLIRIISIE